jgi:hypothetical protein
METVLVSYGSPNPAVSFYYHMILLPGYNYITYRFKLQDKFLISALATGTGLLA